MGMFNYVIGVPKLHCLKCSAKLSSWQTKDGPEEDLACEGVPFATIANFYTPCPKCETWHEWTLIDGSQPGELESYVLSLDQRELLVSPA